MQFLQNLVASIRSGQLPELGYWTYPLLAALVAAEGLAQRGQGGFGIPQGDVEGTGLARDDERGGGLDPAALGGGLAAVLELAGQGDHLGDGLLAGGNRSEDGVAEGYFWIIYANKCLRILRPGSMSGRK